MKQITLILAMSCLMFAGCAARHHGECCHKEKACECEQCAKKEAGHTCGKSCGEKGAGACTAK